MRVRSPLALPPGPRREQPTSEDRSGREALRWVGRTEEALEHPRRHLARIGGRLRDGRARRALWALRKSCGSRTPRPSSSPTGRRRYSSTSPRTCFSGELIDCEIESNTGVHDEPSGVAGDLVLRRRVLLGHAERLGRVLGTSGTHPIGDWREQEIIDKPHYQRLKRKLGWLIRRNNTFSLHVHYAVNGREQSTLPLQSPARVRAPHARPIGQLPVLAGRVHGHALGPRPDVLPRLPPRRSPRSPRVRGTSTWSTWTPSNARAS